MASSVRAPWQACQLEAAVTFTRLKLAWRVLFKASDYALLEMQDASNLEESDRPKSIGYPTNIDLFDAAKAALDAWSRG